MRTTTRTRYLATLGLGLVLLVAAPARADDAPADIVALLERARAAERVEKDLAKAQALYEQVFAKAASTEAGREAGIRLLDLDADRTHEAWLTLIGTLSEAHGATLDKATVDKIVELAQTHLQPGEMVKTPRGVFVRAREGELTEGEPSPALRALQAGLKQLGPINWAYGPGIPDGIETDVDRLVASLGDSARATVEQYLSMRRAPYVDGLLALLRIDASAGWREVGVSLRELPAVARAQLAGILKYMHAWGPVDPPVLLEALGPVLKSDNAESVHERVLAFLLDRADSPADSRYAELARTERLQALWWAAVVSWIGRDAERLRRVVALERYLPSDGAALVQLLLTLMGLDGSYSPGRSSLDASASEGWRDAIAEFSMFALDLPAMRGILSGLPWVKSHAALHGHDGRSQRCIQGLIERTQAASTQALRRRAALWSGRRLVAAPGAERHKWLLCWSASVEIDFADAGAEEGYVPRLLDLLSDLDAASVSSRGGVARAALKLPRVWDGLLDRLSSTEGEESPLAWVLAMDGLPESPPSAASAVLRWVELFLADAKVVPRPSRAIWQAASDLDAARYDRAVLEALTTRGWVVPTEAMLPLGDADVARVQAWLDAMEAPSVSRPPPSHLARNVLAIILQKLGPEPVLQRAEDSRSPFSTEALAVVATSRDLAVQERLVRLATAEAAQQPSPALQPERTLQWLVFADRYPARGLVPLLVTIYETLGSEGVTSRARAASILDQIRDREDRMRYFHAMLDGPDDPEGEILPLLEDTDAAVRQGAIQALGAVGGPRALVQLLKLAKREGAPAGERAAALDAVAKISARAPAGATSTQARSPAAAEAGSGGGK